jgi:hypothetical protein
MATPIPDAAADVATFLEGAGLGLTRGTNLFTLHNRDEIPDEAVLPSVFVHPAGGPPPDPYFGAHSSDHEFQLSIMVRGEKEKAQEGFAFARSISDSLQMATIAPYYSVLLRESAPVPLGTDDHDAPGWTIGVDCRFKS